MTIRITGACQHNLRNLSLDLPRGYARWDDFSASLPGAQLCIPLGRPDLSTQPALVFGESLEAMHASLDARAAA